MMIHELDAVLQAMLHGEAKPHSELQGAMITFAIPDKDWRAQGSGLELNVYLYRALDNRELRSNARRTKFNPDGTISEQQFPARIECSYVISAWNKSTPVNHQDREFQEHSLLSQVLYVLWRNPTIPQRYLTDLSIDPEIPEISPPILAAESEDMAAKPDFWYSLETPVRPSITCRITIEMNLDVDPTPVPAALTTIDTRVVPDDRIITIGGTVRDLAGAPVSAASICVDGLSRTYVTDMQGRFIIDRIAAGAHTLTVKAINFRVGTQPIQVPGLTLGAYDVVLTPSS